MNFPVVIVAYVVFKRDDPDAVPGIDEQLNDLIIR